MKSGYTTYQDLVEYELLLILMHLRYPTTVNASKSKVLKYMNRTDLLSSNKHSIESNNWSNEQSLEHLISNRGILMLIPGLESYVHQTIGL